MQINSRKAILNIDFDEEQNDQIDEQKSTSLPNLPSIKITQNNQYGSHLIKRGMFSCEGDDDDNYIVTHPQQIVKAEESKTNSNSRTQKKPKEIENIRILVQVQHQNHQDNQKRSEQQPSASQQTYEEHQQQNMKKQSPQIKQQNLQYIKPSKNTKLFQINFDQSSSDESIHQQQNIFDQKDQLQKRHQQIIHLLSLKPHERKNVTFQEIATTHDPIQNMRAFSNKHIEMGKILLMNINRDKSGLNVFWPQYELNFLQTGVSMLWAKKMMGNATSNYYITLKSGIDEATNNLYFGKIRSNSVNSVYHVYTKGANPKSQLGNQSKRSIEATIVFQDQKGCYQPRSFYVYTLAIDVKYQQLIGTKGSQQIGLDVLFKLQSNKNKIFCFKTRKPVYSQAIQGYILNFGGRVQKASIKNFILQDSIANRQVLMLGRLNDNLFRVDASWPLKPFVAFCICIANFDSRFVSS